MMILLGVLTTAVFAIQLIVQQDGPGPDVVPINKASYWGMIGFAFFMFEGVGSLLPVMRETEKPEQMPMLTVAALIMLGVIYVLFSFLCYYAWGSDLDEPVVTEMLPADNHFVQAMKLLFCINLVFSYPITIVPTFNTLEAFCLGKKETSTMDGGAEEALGQREETRSQYWTINAMRSCLVLLTVVVVVLVAD